MFNCMVFVVAACTMTLTISAFFKDFKIALEINGTVFSLTAFLVFGYHGNDGNI